MEGDLQRVMGANLRMLRVTRHLSQEAFADALGMHRTYVGALERGERNVTLRTVERFAAMLGVDAIDLLQPARVRTGRRHIARDSA